MTPHLAVLVERVHRLAVDRARVLVGIAGAPGAGKSTLAAELVDALGPAASAVPFDGFHLRSAALNAEQQMRRGAIETFDLVAYQRLLAQLRSKSGAQVLAPDFDRSVEEPIPDAIQISPSIRFVITEGNYLLGDELSEARTLLDEVWFVQLSDELRLARLIARHMSFGKTLSDATDWATGTDQRNADLVTIHAHRADLRIQLDATDR